MSNLEAFLDMGGYAVFIWPSYIVSAVVLIALYVRSRQRLKAVERELSAIESKIPRRSRSPDNSIQADSHDT